MNFYQKSAKKITKRLYRNCTGCGLCVAICPNSAISLSVNKNLSPFPIIDAKKCVNCNQCLSRCPTVRKNKEDFFPKRYYIAKSKAKTDIENSSSGGVFYALAKEFLKDGYYIAGAIYTNGFKEVQHIVTNSIDDLEKMRGSKYAKSDLHQLYNKLILLVKNGEKIFFSGLGCECAAVKSLLRNYLDNVILCQLVCKGNMLPIVLTNYISFIESTVSSSIVSYTMRYKKEGKGYPVPAYERIVFSNGRETLSKYYQTTYGKIFASNALLMKACFKCNFRGNNAVGDIIIGDYSHYSNIDVDGAGLSLFTINSQKGLRIFETTNSLFLTDISASSDIYQSRFFFNPIRIWFLSSAKIANLVVSNRFLEADKYISSFSIAFKIYRKIEQLYRKSRIVFKKTKQENI